MNSFRLEVHPDQNLSMNPNRGKWGGLSQERRSWFGLKQHMFSCGIIVGVAVPMTVLATWLVMLTNANKSLVYCAIYSMYINFIMINENSGVAWPGHSGL